MFRAQFLTAVAALISLFLVGAASPLEAQAGSQSGSRVALVIGNSDYQAVQSLPNAASDASLIAQKLWESGFEVIESIDSDREEMLSDLALFRSRLREGSEAVLYYAGHGVRIGSRNYLLPVSVVASSVEELTSQSIDAQLFVDMMNGSGANINIILLDACRNNPFEQIGDKEADRIATRAIEIGVSRQAVVDGLEALANSGQDGLAEMSAGKTETFIGFATAPGQVAYDGIGSHSPYAEAIARNLETSGVELGDLFRLVRKDVREITGGRQIAWNTSTLEREFYFRPSIDSLRPSSTTTDSRLGTLGMLPPRRVVDRAFWRAIVDRGRADAFLAYLKLHPNGAFVAEAEELLEQNGGSVAANDNPVRRAIGLPESQSNTSNQAEIAADLLARADIEMPIGTNDVSLTKPNESGGWVFLPEAPRFGILSVQEDGTDGVHWVDAGEQINLTPFVGLNGGTDNLRLERLNPGGTREIVQSSVEVFVHACDLLAGMAQDSQKVTAGVRQFIINRNFEAAIVACEIATEEFPEIPRFWAQLARSYRSAGRYNDALIWQTKAADAGYLAATVNLGQMYLDGQAVEKNPNTAIELFRLAAQGNETAAYTALGWAHRAGVGVEQSFEKAMEWYVRGAEAGNDWAMTNIGELYQKGKGVEQDPALALNWYIRAAQSGELTAQTRLARMYQNGDGVPKDVQRAQFWLETAAGRGVPNAKTRLGLLYEKGEGIQQNLESAHRLYLAAAEDGDDEAILRLGNLYASENQLYDDPEIAARLLQVAVDRDVDRAIRPLARLYEAGRGVEKNLEKAINLYRAASESNPWAARDVGRLYLMDDPAVRNFEEARIWFERAVEGGVPWAARDLARMYATGRGVEKDATESLIYYATAFDMSDDQRLRDIVEEETAGTSTKSFNLAAQVLLGRKDYAVGAPDGVLGPKTKQALAEALSNAGESFDGAIGLSDLGALAR
jgi:TPR repeat protein/uncharacterized caspase-like protein